MNLKKLKRSLADELKISPEITTLSPHDFRQVSAELGVFFDERLNGARRETLRRTTDDELSRVNDIDELVEVPDATVEALRTEFRAICLRAFLESRPD